MEREYKSAKEQKQEAVLEMRKQSLTSLRRELATDGRLYHKWAVEALEQVIQEKESK